MGLRTGLGRWRVVWRGRRRHHDGPDLDDLRRAACTRHVRDDAQAIGLARRGEQDPGSEGQARKAGEEPEQSRREAAQELPAPATKELVIRVSPVTFPL